MKKILILLTTIIIFSLSACSENKVGQDVSNNTTENTSIEETSSEEPTTQEPTTEDTSYVPNGVTPQAIKDVIFNDAEFICVIEEHFVNDVGFKTKNYKMSEFNYNTGDFEDKTATLGAYCVIDLDQDGYNEVVAETSFIEQILIFHYEADQVYGFVTSYRSVIHINYDGVIHGSSGAAVSREYTIEFDKDTYTKTTVAKMDNDDCYISDKKVTIDEYVEYVNQVLFKDTVPTWTDYSLLKNLSSDENDTTEEPTTEDTSYIPNGVTPQAIKDVIFNDAEFICVIEEHFINDVGLKTKNYKMSEFNYNTGDFEDKTATLGAYRVIDLDQDGYNEVVAETSFIEQIIIFHYEADQVYGFVTCYRAMTRINYDGVISGSSGAAVSDDYTIDFDKDTYTETIVAKMDNDDCYIGDKKVTIDEYIEYVNQVLFKDTVPTWTDYSLLN